MPGGALHQGEEPLAAARRELAEEVGVVISDYELVTLFEDDHGGWSYWTAIVEVPGPFTVEANWETDETAWVPASSLGELELLAPFRQTLARLGLLASL